MLIDVAFFMSVVRKGGWAKEGKHTGDVVNTVVDTSPSLRSCAVTSDGLKVFDIVLLLLWCLVAGRSGRGM